jgi:hypothetical protein
MRTGSKAFESDKDLSSSGESRLFFKKKKSLGSKKNIFLKLIFF